jgi:tetratricopeptide (TPR) repeat protein
MPVAEMERRFYELKGKLEVGAISEEDFKTEVEKLRFQDAQDRWWMIGAQSGKWYMYNGTRWIPGVPPSESPVSAPPPPEIGHPAPSALSAESPKDESNRPPTPAAPPRTEPIPPHPPTAREPSLPRQPEKPTPSFQLPPRGPLLVGCAALLALLSVIAFWIAVDNLVPGRPISSLISGKPSPSAPVTRTAGPVSIPGNEATALVNAGDELVLKSLFDAAIAQYQVAAQMAPSNPTPLTRWSRALALRGNPQDAVAKAHQATQRAPNDAEAQAQLARAMAWNGQWADALPIAEKAVQLDSKSANAHAFLAEIYLQGNRSADGQTQAQMALQLAPQSAEAHRAMAWVLTVTGQKDAALAEWRQTVALEPDLFFRHFEFAEVDRVYFGNSAEAVTEYLKAIGLYGAYIPLYSRLGLAFLSLNQPSSAIDQFRRGMALDPNDDDGYAYLGLAYGMSNQCSQAIPYFEQALRLNANNSLAAKGLSDCRGGQALVAPAASPPKVPLIPPPVTSAAAAEPNPPAPPPAVTPAAPVQPRTNPTPAAPTPGAYPYSSGRIIFPLYDANAKTLALFQASAADGGGRMLVANDASSASVRSDGALLLFTNWAPGQRGIWVMLSDGSSRYALTEGSEHALASLSPDGSAFVFTARAGSGETASRPLRLMVGNTSKLNRAEDLRVLGEGQAPTWGPNNRIAFKPCGQGGCGLALTSPEGSGVATLAQFEDTTVPAWSPDGTKIVVGARTGGESWNLFLIDVAQGSALQLTNQLATDGPAAFSPDGKSLAFLSSRNSQWAIWAMNTDGSNLHKVFDLGGAPGGPVRQESPLQPGQFWWDQRIVWAR